MTAAGGPGGVPAVTPYLCAEDVQAALDRARAAGATVQREAEDQGVVVATFLDPSDHRWMVLQEK